MPDRELYVHYPVATEKGTLITVDLQDTVTAESDAVVGIELMDDCMEVRVSGFLVATFPMGANNIQ